MFDTKQRFMDGLRCAYGGGTFILGSKVSSACVRAFVAHLKADFENQDEPRVFRQAEYIGYQGGSYWLISSKVLNFVMQLNAINRVNNKKRLRSLVVMYMCTILQYLYFTW